MHVSASPVQPGTVLAGKYRVERVLGQGGMGVVVAATHLQLDKLVALKFMLPHALTNAEAVERFLREARAAVRLKSQHVAHIHDVGTLDGGSPYIVMEYLEGTDMAGAIHARTRLTPTQTADIILQACDAIAEAHSLGIVHRDLKPANLYLANVAGGATVVKVLDFGISKGTGLNEQAVTRTAHILGSPAYMSPEQMRAAKHVDPRADIWSLGVIMYEAVSGRVPFMSEAFTDLCLKILMDPTPPLVDVNGVPPSFEAIIKKCLEKNPADRYANVAKLAQALAPFASPALRSIALKIPDILNVAARAGAPTQQSMPAQPHQSVTTLGGSAGSMDVPPSSRRRGKIFAAVGFGVIAAGIGVAVAMSGGKSAPTTTAPVEPPKAAVVPAADVPPPTPAPVVTPIVAPTPAPPAETSPDAGAVVDPATAPTAPIARPPTPRPRPTPQPAPTPAPTPRPRPPADPMATPE